MANESVPITAASHAPVGAVQAQRYLVVFRLEAQGYAIPVEAILQIIEMVAITPIPQINPVVEGLINLRGEVVPVLNLRRYLGMSGAPLQLHTPIILVHHTGADATGAVWQKAGLIVDEVLDVMTVRDEAITSLPGILPEGLRQAPMVQGLVHHAHDLVILLDVAQLFASEQLPPLSMKSATLAELLPESAPFDADVNMLEVAA
ncbi:MAG TPA: chemotaxis protein CheW [Anaerolineae bacterium]|nr:chemotaxis protein CheW [Anaerolineae bacterium]